MRGIKIPQQDFALKMPGGLMREGGIFARHYGTNKANSVQSIFACVSNKKRAVVAKRLLDTQRECDNKNCVT